MSDLIVIDPNGIKILELEHMNTLELQHKGLQHRDMLPDGMALLFPTTHNCAYHMNNVKFPIDICFIDANGMIVGIERMEPGWGKARTPVCGCWAIETNAGFWRNRNLGLYSTIRIPGMV